MLRRVLLGLLAVASALGLAVAGRIAWVGYWSPPGASVTAAQVEFLQRSIAAGDGVRMQRLFPEGDFFLRVLTAMAAARTPSADVETVRALRDSLDAPEQVAVFGSGRVPEHGIFQAGWALAVAVDLARASGDSSREAELLGLPMRWRGERRYVFGALPVGDAFLAWARTRPAAEPLLLDPGTEPGRPWWPAFGVPILLPVAVLVAVGRLGRRP